MKNSFNQVPHPFQIFAYIIELFNLGLFFPLLLGLEQLAGKIILAIIFFVAAVLLIVSTIKCSCSDSTDPLLLQYRNAIENGKNFKANKEMTYCDDCKGFVSNKSKHCRSCNRCVKNFDHHCKWINNCIGYQNYKSFLVMIGSVLIELSAFTVVVGLLTSQEMRIGDLSMTLLIIGQVIGVINLLLMIMVAFLIIFHTYLNLKGISTLQYLKGQVHNQDICEQAIAYFDDQSNSSKVNHAISEIHTLQ